MTDIYTRKIGDIWFGVAYEDKTVLGTTFANSEKNALQGLNEAVHRDVSKQTQKETIFAKHVVETLKNMYDGKKRPSSPQCKIKTPLQICNKSNRSRIQSPRRLHNILRRSRQNRGRRTESSRTNNGQKPIRPHLPMPPDSQIRPDARRIRRRAKHEARVPQT